jgi:hypothetical protein
MYQEKIQIYIRPEQKKEFHNFCKAKSYKMSDRLREHIVRDIKEWKKDESNKTHS